MTPAELGQLYRRYLDCLNRRDWDALGEFVADDAAHNGQPFGLAGYRRMLERDVRQIPDLRFEIDQLVTEPPMVASRLRFDCTPQGDFLGVPVNGRRIVFTENVFYRFRNGKIAEVWSLLDRAAVEAQCRAQR
ncbi:ester cyclase [Burkholderia sp. Ac-20379]|uniref:ester cyclase n=1 Tax=Burkholderia sp. Ac-20379 TaxID=2703900 RepID=UPI001980EFAC|nr:ester cyclase [Burkholderia sp. Ac-20379]MBN3728057.1 ester cyclase [Burkholderia sp. Ac-20379]